MVAVFETDNQEKFLRVFDVPTTAEVMVYDEIVSGVEKFVLDMSYLP